ncbi:hypothetical protein HRR83_006511 [Exophiala dermatitidis]|uniref:Uncharacterized protein n=2 Tax=Exophiala dermatitidis TaxID=5970 RepID=H6CAI7_EXODN|nr:uncharacterized protein HMPREF1120_08122 [Exophiala dermatitidis NIH/UT8656]XP_009160612.1 hypothetical protein, variant [Exophiala dermatitidis NIH/UT8656]KAJ4504613.1 hypothetical protein HRR73_008788 [Exophiala dermatitidis]EHY60150.1 hypothetical protein, variant [Exophiala dermatitidis NIH/UT8656]EHY60151.1 hypothetical protein HMPREF1120_08122 [Exophiala dermatitidis NIH/UT8656]KAJ4505303.1 hypothetical protein HRR74_008673 [Exophiala dermatitidis]KAJ4530712.1 hypothetical protein HR
MWNSFLHHILLSSISLLRVAVRMACGIMVGPEEVPTCRKGGLTIEIEVQNVPSLAGSDMVLDANCLTGTSQYLVKVSRQWAERRTALQLVLSSHPQLLGSPGSRRECMTGMARGENPSMSLESTRKPSVGGFQVLPVPTTISTLRSPSLICGALLGQDVMPTSYRSGTGGGGEPIPTVFIEADTYSLLSLTGLRGHYGMSRPKRTMTTRGPGHRSWPYPCPIDETADL